MRKQRVPRYLLVLCLLLIVANFSGCAAPTAADSLSQSTANASQADDSLIPGPSQELPSDSPQGQWQSLDAAQSSQSNALSADSAMSQQETDEDAPQFAPDMPQDIQRRVLEAEKIDQLDLTDLTFMERCQLVLLWKTIWQAGIKRRGIGMVDLTLDGCPEFIVEKWGVDGIITKIYELSGNQVQVLMSTPPLLSSSTSVFTRENNLLQDKTWGVYATVFPDSTVGGIIHKTGNKVGIDTIYYTVGTGGKYPLEKCLDVYGSIWRTIISPDSDEQDWVVDYMLHYAGEETQLAEDFPNHNVIPRWGPDCTQEEFLESVKGTWLDVLNDLPRDPWQSPVIYPPGPGPDCRDYPIYIGMPWQEMTEKVQSLIDEYNQLLQDGDYDIPPVS